MKKDLNAANSAVVDFLFNLHREQTLENLGILKPY
jgi:hypothetical protein